MYASPDQRGPEHFHNMSQMMVKLYSACFKEYDHRTCAYNTTIERQSREVRFNIIKFGYINKYNINK